MRIVIIGAGAAGVSAAETIRKQNADAEITVINEEDSVPYSPVALPEFIEGKISREQLYLWNNDYLSKKKISYVRGKTVISVDVNAKKVIAEDGSVFPYDKLLIATGARPIIPEELKNKRGVFTLRTLKDAETIRSKIKERAIIYGAGAVAVKTAVALRRIGVDVIILCRSRVLRRLFDEDICRLIHDLLIANGVKIVGIHEQMRLLGDPIEKLRLGTQEFKCDGVIAALGVAPNLSFLDPSQIKLGKSGGVIVNEKMQTSAPDVYAAGDCCETIDITSGSRNVIALWPPAVEQGKVAALNMLGINAIYEGTLPQNMVDVFDTTFASIGSLDGEKITISSHTTIKRFTVKNGEIIGAQLVGDVDEAGIISTILKRKLQKLKFKEAHARKSTLAMYIYSNYGGFLSKFETRNFMEQTENFKLDGEITKR
jgi:NAD(P)H-nitrite reductase large subunit